MPTYKQTRRNALPLSGAGKEICSGVGISIGGIEYDGLGRMKPASKEMDQRDVNELLRMKR